MKRLIGSASVSSCRIGSRIDSTIIATMPPITHDDQRFEQRQRGRGEACRTRAPDSRRRAPASCRACPTPRPMPPYRRAAAGTPPPAASPPTGCRRRGSPRRSRREAARSARLWTVATVSVSPSSSGSRLATIVASVRAMPRGVEIAHQPAEQRQPQQRAIERAAGSPDRAARASTGTRPQQRRAPAPTTSRRGSRKARSRSASAAAASGRRSSNCSTTCGTTNTISANTTRDRDQRQHDRISERRHHLAAHLAPAVRAGRPAVRGSTAACPSPRPPRPSRGRAAESSPPRASSPRTAAAPRRRRHGPSPSMRAHLLLLGLPRDRAQRLLERADRDERRKLAGEQGELLGRQPLARRRSGATASGARAARRRGAAPASIRDDIEPLARSSASRAHPRSSGARTCPRFSRPARIDARDSRNQASLARVLAPRRSRTASSGVVTPLAHQRAARRAVSVGGVGEGMARRSRPRRRRR